MMLHPFGVVAAPWCSAFDTALSLDLCLAEFSSITVTGPSGRVAAPRCSEEKRRQAAALQDALLPPKSDPVDVFLGSESVWLEVPRIQEAPHSYLNAIIGSTRIARRAGRRHAIIAITPSTTA